MTKIQVDNNGRAISIGGKVLSVPDGGGSAVINSLNITPTTSQQTITASGNVQGYAPISVAAVTSSIDSNIQSGNIKKNVTILGVTGTYEGSGGGGIPLTGHTIQVIDYDGTLLKIEKLAVGDTFTLPSVPIHEDLIFQEWSSPIAITNNQITVPNYDVIIGPIYTTKSGLSEFDVTVTAATGLTVKLNMNGTKDWGDGASNTSTSHTYAAAGNYTIKCDGTTITSSSSSGLFSQSSASSSRNYYVTHARLANITNIKDYTFQYCISLRSVSIPNSVTSVNTYAFAYCFSLGAIIIPDSIQSIPNSFLYFCRALTNVVIPYGVTSIGENAFNTNRNLLSLIMPDSITSYGGGLCRDCYGLSSVHISANIENPGNYTFNGCYPLHSITIPEGMPSIKAYMFSDCISLTSITVPSSVTSVEAEAFSSCSQITEYDFSTHTSVPSLVATSAFNNINKICKIKVPQNLLATWKTATNWSTYANYIEGV